MATETWRQVMEAELRCQGESFDDLIAHTPMALDWDKEFDAGFGCAEGEPFLAWTENRVYFPHEYDGAESVWSMPRNPCDKPFNHGNRDFED